MRPLALGRAFLALCGSTWLLLACGEESGAAPGSAGAGGMGAGARSSGGQSSGGKQATGGRAPVGTGGTNSPVTSSETYGDPVSGQYHLGPVDFAESQWHNACAPAGGYRTALRAATGLGAEYLAGLSNQHAAGGARCDACILIRTAQGRSIVARVVTYGVEAEPGDIDVSPSVYEALNTGEYPRSMTWQFANCPGDSKLQYEFQTGANVWWTSFWVRNAKVPIEKVEVQSTNQPTFSELRRELDGTLNADSGFGELGGSVVTDRFEKFEPGQLLSSDKQF
jgi:expansin